MLLSYAYYGKKLPAQVIDRWLEGYRPDLFLDSGAFTAWSQGVPVPLDRYVDWIKAWSAYTDRYSNLDVIGDAAATYANQQRMLDAGLRPIPTYHVGEPFDWLERYLDEGYRLIALGGMVPHAKRPAELLPHLVKCFQLARGRAVFHGFGITGWRLIKPLPWYSVDSSGWTFVFRHLTTILFDTRAGEFRSVERDDVRGLYKYAPIFRELGFDPKDFINRRGSRELVGQLTAMSYMAAERYVRRIHGDIVIPGGAADAEAGFPALLRDGSTGYVPVAGDATGGASVIDEAGFQASSRDERPVAVPVGGARGAQRVAGASVIDEAGFQAVPRVDVPRLLRERGASDPDAGLKLYLGINSDDNGRMVVQSIRRMTEKR